ncbi:aldose 1-epimerase family protein [Alsobacter sp. SYSU M60028]|uniref:Aldose 1-epimerase family protein n=1 Tax=Alsobacter ponti TaxID=2962936 RepID=A0ABT1LC94_9HYPH|nr:aldose 1-epimerase family protein [Alsobacter ponti]MCP8938528.1 aldose 1-epimerase family protein [Alsobacter ponti]
MEEARLESGAARAVVSSHGAELREWSVDGRDLLWHGDDRWWGDCSPVLFPVVGWTRGGKVRVGGREYPLGLHGFAHESVFSVVERGPDRVRLALEDDARTRALYPFAFRLELAYRLTPEAIEVEISVANRGDGTMPYAAGLHPGFRWPLPGAEGKPHAIEFEAAERPEVPVIAPGGLFSRRTRPIPLRGRVLPVDSDVFSAEALCFLGAASKSLRFGAPGAELSVTLENLPGIVLWSRPGAPFLCIEGWSGMGDPEDFEGDLFEKPGMAKLEPGETAVHRMTFSFRANT